MIINKLGETFTYDGIVYEIGAEIIATDSSEYEGLIGSIYEIRCGDDMETENDDVDFYCCFDVPAFQKERETLESRFTKLYREPMSIDDIALDMVIMGADMIKPFDHAAYVLPAYSVTEEWANNDDYGNNINLFADIVSARAYMNKLLFFEKTQGCLNEWKEDDCFREEMNKTAYDGWIEGDQTFRHYSLKLRDHALNLNRNNVGEIGRVYDEYLAKQASQEGSESNAGE